MGGKDFLMTSEVFEGCVAAQLAELSILMILSGGSIQFAVLKRSVGAACT